VQHRHCPNLVPNDYDRKRFKRLRNRTSVIVWMDKNPKMGPSWPSLAHFWNDWYESYLNVDYPHLLIRFEDTLYHPKEVLKQVCQCGGAQLIDHQQHSYLVDEAKWNHKHSQNNMISAMIKYGTDHRRYNNMTEDDLQFARSSLNRDLMTAFHYKVA
jgi:hypothetical protein